MSRDINEFIGIPGIPNLAGFGIDSGIDLAYLQGNSEDEAPGDDRESDLDEDSGDSDGMQSGERLSEIQSESKAEEGEGDMDMSFERAKLKKKGQNLGGGETPDADADVFGELSKYAAPGPFKAAKRPAHEPYKVPILYRSKKGGVKYKLSEILIPRDPRVIEANLAFNKKEMKNKLLSLGNEATLEIKRKLKESLKDRNENLLKIIKESSMRLLLKEFLYFKSDLTLKANERILKDIHNEGLLRKLHYRKVKEIKSYIEKNLKQKLLEEEKKREQEEKERIEQEKERVARLKGSARKEDAKPNTLSITFSLKKENLLLTTAERAKAMNEICKGLNDHNVQMQQKNDFNENQVVATTQFGTFPLNPLKGTESLADKVVEEIKCKAILQSMYPTIEAKDNNSVEAECNKFLDTVNFSNWNEDVTTSKTAGENDNKKVRFDLNNDMQSSMNPAASKMQESKEDNDDLFAEDTSKKPRKEANDDDLFAENSPKNDNDDSDDFFGGASKETKKTQQKEYDPFNEFEDDDPFAESVEKVKEEQKDAPMPDLKTQKSIVGAGDIFTKQLNFSIPQPKPPKVYKSFRYFGELDDADSIYQIKYDSHKKMKNMLRAQTELPLELVKTDTETIKVQERVKLDDVRNKKLIESKIFDKLSLYNFRNKRLDGPIQLGLLQPNKYSKVNFENKVEKISLILENDQRRKDLKFNFEENMDKLYDTDIREVMSAIDAKRRKEFEDKHGHEFPEDERMPDVSKPEPTSSKVEDISALDTNDIDDISSIDSDTKEEEKKFRVHDAVLGGAQNVMSSNVSDLIQHAKCYTFEYLE